MRGLEVDDEVGEVAAYEVPQGRNPRAVTFAMPL